MGDNPSVNTAGNKEFRYIPSADKTKQRISTAGKHRAKQREDGNYTEVQPQDISSGKDCIEEAAKAFNVDGKGINDKLRLCYDGKGSMDIEKFTPMMQQYMEIKDKYRYCILFYRLGDFYEMFFEDAILASRELEITLTGKDCGATERAPMCGVPYHSADGYIARLVEKGYKVAICEQVEDPKAAKGIVRREVIRVITPGTLLDTKVLDERANNYLMCIHKSDKAYGIATCDVTTGEFLVTKTPPDNNKVIDEIARFNPAELIATFTDEDNLFQRIGEIFSLKVEVRREQGFNLSAADVLLCNHFKTINLAGYGLEREPECIIAAGGLLKYLKSTQMNDLGHITSIKRYEDNGYMVLDIGSRRNLELTATVRDRSKRGSLLWVLDKTNTAMGARLLRSWLEQPLTDVTAINKRLKVVAVLKEDVFKRSELKEALSGVRDIERLMTKVVYQSANARDMLALMTSFSRMGEIKGLMGELDADYARELSEAIDPLRDIGKQLFDAIDPEPPLSVKDGGIIREGYNNEVDKLRQVKNNASQMIIQMETELREKLDTKGLKIGFNKVFGYYVEVRKTALDKVPDYFVRKQTLVNCERFSTPELKEFEEILLRAEGELNDLEYKLFQELRLKVAGQMNRIQTTAAAVAASDVLCSFGEVAEAYGYVEPQVDNSCDIDIQGGRHPVVERTLPEGSFIPNDLHINGGDNRLQVITGPNMAGKSTFMRQAALIVIMAQIGSFVPAERANIGVTHRIFTRVGASDDLATGQSTFMVEMGEVANILNNAGKTSLLILDEIGRGTSTYDGLSIAWAVLEYLALRVGARTLFATHYHELTELEGKVEGVKNYCVSVKEQGEDVIFLRKIIPGGTDRSYGIHVAKLAGVPSVVTYRAEELLKALSRENNTPGPVNNEDFVYTFPTEEELRAKELIGELNGLDLNSMSPLDALKELFRLKEILEN